MRLDILPDNLIRYITCRHSKVAACPQMPSPELAAQLTKLFQHPSATAAFQPLYQVADGQVRRHRQVNMIHRYMPADDIHVQRRTRLPDQLAQRCCWSTHKTILLVGAIHRIAPTKMSSPTTSATGLPPARATPACGIW